MGFGRSVASTYLQNEKKNNRLQGVIEMISKPSVCCKATKEERCCLPYVEAEVGDVPTGPRTGCFGADELLQKCRKYTL